MSLSAQAEATMQARATLSAGLDTELAELRVLRPGRRLGEIGLFVAIWAVGVGLGVAGMAQTGIVSWLLRGTGIALSAAALNAFVLLSHEGHHNVLFRHRVVNYVANLLLCTPLLHAPSAYRVLHELHHRFLGGPGD